MNIALFFKPFLAISIFWAFAIVVVAGLLGGLVGYLMNNAVVKWKRAEFLKSLLFGIVVSGVMLVVLLLMYSELFVVEAMPVLNFILIGCICFMFAVVILMFAYHFLMRVTSSRKATEPPLKIKQH